jgi:tRNA(fMet)-specific endonuclease VapC
VIALLESDQGVLSNLDRAPEVFIPAIVLGELSFGAAKSLPARENTAKIERFGAGRHAGPALREIDDLQIAER